MTAEVLIAFSGSLLALLFAYVPGFASWYQALGEQPDGTNDNGTTKRLVMLGLLVGVSVAVFALSCAGLAADLGLNVTCDRTGAVGLVMALVLAIIANQSTYAVLPKVGLNASPPKEG